MNDDFNSPVVIAELFEAARIINRNPPPDVVLLDLSFPESNMEQTLARLDEFEERSIIVLVTGAKRHQIEAIIGTRVVEIVEKNNSIFDDSIFKTIARAVNARRDKKSEERLNKIDDALQKFYSLENGDTGQGLSHPK